MTSGFAKVIENIDTSSYIETPETDLHKAENAYSNKYANSWS